MPWQPSDETINEDTPLETLHRIIQAAARTSDTNTVRAAGEARAEIDRREWRERTNQLETQLNAQQGMIESLIESTHELSEQQTVNATQIANRQIRISRTAAIAAWGAAIAAILTLVFNVVLLFVGQQPPTGS